MSNGDLSCQPSNGLVVGQASHGASVRRRGQLQPPTDLKTPKIIQEGESNVTIALGGGRIGGGPATAGLARPRLVPARIEREQTQDGGFPGDDRAFYIIVN
jgi:hypothetical protein